MVYKNTIMFYCFPPLNVMCVDTDQQPWANPKCIVARLRVFGTRESVPSPSWREHLPHNKPGNLTNYLAQESSVQREVRVI